MTNGMPAYCFKCRRKVQIKNPQRVTLKNGRPATRGVCPVCGTKVFRIGKSQELTVETKQGTEHSKLTWG